MLVKIIMQITWRYYTLHLVSFRGQYHIRVQYHDNTQLYVDISFKGLIITKSRSCLYSLFHPQFSAIKDVRSGMYVLLNVTKQHFTSSVKCVWHGIQRIAFAHSVNRHQCKVFDDGVCTNKFFSDFNTEPTFLFI